MCPETPGGETPSKAHTEQLMRLESQSRLRRELLRPYNPENPGIVSDMLVEFGKTPNISGALRLFIGYKIVGAQKNGYILNLLQEQFASREGISLNALEAKKPFDKRIYIFFNSINDKMDTGAGLDPYEQKVADVLRSDFGFMYAQYPHLFNEAPTGIGFLKYWEKVARKSLNERLVLLTGIVKEFGKNNPMEDNGMNLTAGIVLESLQNTLKSQTESFKTRYGEDIEPNTTAPAVPPSE